MTAVITDILKKQILVDIFDDVASNSGVVDSAGDTGGYYTIGIGRSEPWNDSDVAPTALNSLREQRNFRQGLQSIKAAEDVSFSVPRNNWASSSIYSGYDDAVQGYPTDYPYYVITEDNRVYICLNQGKNASGEAVPSTVKPDLTHTRVTSFKTADGYVWKFLYTLSATRVSKFLSSNFMPVQLQGPVVAGRTQADSDQHLIELATITGQIANIEVTAGGTGYTSAPTVAIIGNGDSKIDATHAGVIGESCSATAIISGGSVVNVILNLDSAASIASNPTHKVRHGRGYDFANITFSGGAGSGATARAALSTPLGFGGDARDDLKATSLMFNTKPAGTESGKFLVGQDFRQVALIRNPKDSADAFYTGATGLGLRKLNLASVGTAFTTDKTILGGTSGAKGFIDFDSGLEIFYHQTEATGFTPFAAGENITEVSGSGAGVAAAVIDSDHDISRLKGDILYIENRAAIDRTSDQTEDIKVIIQI